MKKIISAFAATLFCCGLAGTATAAEYTYSYVGSDLAITTNSYGNHVYITDSDFFEIAGEPTYGNNVMYITDIDALGNITDVDVYVDVVFTEINNLDIYVVHSWVDGEGAIQSKMVQLYNDGDTAWGYEDLPSITFSDQAAESITNVDPVGGNSFQAYPSGGTYQTTLNFDGFGDGRLLSAFNDDPATGEWSLAIWENYEAGEGYVNDFSVIITTDAETSPVPLPGALVCLGSGLSALAAVRRVRRK